jgi:hypothetical protein
MRSSDMINGASSAFTLYDIVSTLLAP